jgi:hypothetical protein
MVAISLEDASLLLIGVGFLLGGFFGHNFSWSTGVAMPTGKPMPSWLGRLVFSAVGLSLLVFEGGHLMFGWTGL